MKERSRAANGERKTERKRGRRREQSLGIFETCLFRIKWRRHEQLMHRTGRLSKNSGRRKAIKQDFERCSPVLFNTNIPFRCLLGMCSVLLAVVQICVAEGVCSGDQESQEGRGSDVAIVQMWRRIDDKYTYF